MPNDVDMSDAVLIGLDWGTTNVRAALLTGDAQVLAVRHARSGVGKDDEQGFEQTFADLTADWPQVPALAAGMVGSRQGWKEAGYLSVPTRLNAIVQGLTTFKHGDRTVSIVPGLQLDTDGRCDVMRGEETQLAGLINRKPSFSGTVIMPGTHCKWVQLSDGTISSFRTYVTGDLFNALANHTMLKHSVGTEDEPNEEIFAQACKEVADHAGSISGMLFNLRAQDLLHGANPLRNREMLSALLICEEVRAAISDGFDLSSPSVLVGAPALTSRYKTVLAAMGHETGCETGTELVWPALLSMARNANLIDG